MSNRFRIGEICLYWIYGETPVGETYTNSYGWYRAEIINEEFLFGEIRYTLKILDGAWIGETETDVPPRKLKKL